MAVTVTFKDKTNLRFSALSTDTKPTLLDTIAFAELLETDTGRIFLWHANEWHDATVWKSYSFESPTGSTGRFYIAGYYEAPAADANLTQASTTQTLGVANIAHGAHAFVVAGGAGSASGGSGAGEVEVSGTSITDKGVRTANDTEIVVADITAESEDAYSETTKKWIGQLTYTLQVAIGGTHTTFSFDFNYGFAKYEDYGNTLFNCTDLECVGRGGAADSGFDIILFKHSSTGWDYDASAFVPGGTILAQMSTNYSTEREIADLTEFAYKLDNINAQDIAGNNGEGVVLAIITTANKAVEQMDNHIGISVS